MKTKEKNCKSRWLEHKNGRISDLRKLWNADCKGEDSKEYKKVAEEIGTFSEYGLGFDYVEGKTDYNKGRGYFRYQLSWGGPSDEFRFYVTDGFKLDRIEYVFMDWFDGFSRKIIGKDEWLLTEIFSYFVDCGMAGTALNQAIERE